MLKKVSLKKVIVFLVLLLAVFQLFRIDKTNPPVDPSKDFLTITHAPASVAKILRASCYDCHSHEVVYPWYTNIAPVSWWIRHHVNDGVRHLNFSSWGTYSSRKADHKLKECVENIEEGEMPMSSYTLIHTSAKLSANEQALLMGWFSALRTGESDKPGKK